MVILAMVLDSVGIPPGGVMLLIGVDRILDMMRTAVNVMGDLVACVVLDRYLGEPVPNADGAVIPTPPPQPT
jgi:Na+/H+-dicarboxylate symporter